MNMRKVGYVLGCIVLVLVAVGLVENVVGESGRSHTEVVAALEPGDVESVASGISYQGRLTSDGGGALNGTYTMRFVVYNADVAGSALWDSGNTPVSVENGLFNVKLGVDPADFNGQALWLSIIVDGQTLSPRQELLPAPYALSLRPGAEIVGEAIGASGSVLAGRAPATGTALRAEAAGGAGLYSDSQHSYGVWGASENSWGGYFTSAEGIGVRVHTDGPEIFDFGAHVSANGGFGLLAQSQTNQAVVGEAGDITGIARAVGAVGVVGIGANRGTYGSSSAGVGIYGVSNSNYGIWGQSTTYRGVTGRTSRSDNNYGFYTPDNIYGASYNFTGSIMQVMQNSGPEALAQGDVVVFAGINHDVAAAEGPIVQVRKSTDAGSTAVAGVVFSRFNIDAIDDEAVVAALEAGEMADSMPVTMEGEAGSGEYVLVVVQGLAQVNVGAVSGPIAPGDLLASGATPGIAALAPQVAVGEAVTAAPGTVFGKALEALVGDEDGEREMIYIYVTLQ